MTERTTSITRRLILSMLALELLAAVVLIAAVANHERRVRFEGFDANLRATANALLGGVQEAEGNDGGVLLDTAGIDIPKRSIFRVTEEHGRVLGAAGVVPSIGDRTGGFTSTTISDHRYRFYLLSGERVIDPGFAQAVHHHITVVYGLPEGRIWHEVLESVRFFAIATIALLGITALILSWLIRKSFLPIRELAYEADKINSNNWQFDSPASAKGFSELSPLATAIETTISRLHRAFQQQRRMTSDAAHELKTDTAIIKSSFQVLTMKQRTVEEYQRGISAGIHDIGRLEQTVQKMLTLARLEQGLPIERHNCRIDDVLLDTIAQSTGLAEMKRIRVESILNADSDVPLSREDAGLLCSNVLVNAIQHSFDEGDVTVTSALSKHAVTITITDHGEGIHEADRPYLFDAFYRADLSRSRKSGGTGLGLSICKAICEQVDGTIEIENRVEGGAEVRITLPSSSIES